MSYLNKQLVSYHILRLRVSIEYTVFPLYSNENGEISYVRAIGHIWFNREANWIFVQGLPSLSLILIIVKNEDGQHVLYLPME